VDRGLQISSDSGCGRLLSARIFTLTSTLIVGFGNSNQCMLLIILGDVARVNGQLAVSRAFGDKNLKSHLRSDPDIQYADINLDTDFLILASDGLWKVIHLSLSKTW
jgi:hypothetical protein